MADTARLDELRRRVESDPASILFATLAEELRRAGRFDEAVETSRSGLRFHPAYASARVTLGRSLVELGEHSQAERELRLVLRSSPDNLAARRALGDLYWRQLDLGLALEEYWSATALAPADEELGEIVHVLERELAQHEIDGMALEASPSAPPAQRHVLASKTLTALERFHRAIVSARNGHI
jgi:tetratricopeptide (TPR) repeat protein